MLHSLTGSNGDRLLVVVPSGLLALHIGVSTGNFAYLYTETAPKAEVCGHFLPSPLPSPTSCSGN